MIRIEDFDREEFQPVAMKPGQLLTMRELKWLAENAPDVRICPYASTTTYPVGDMVRTWRNNGEGLDNDDAKSGWIIPVDNSAEPP